MATSLRPFFGFYGGKWRDAGRNYPAPECETIVEPFAGSAGYSLRFPDRQVILCEIDPIIAAVWKYLIHVSPDEIRAIPDIPDGGSVEDLRVCQEAKWLVGFWLNRGVARPRKSPSKWMRDGIRPGSFWGDRVRHTVASQVDAIRHWKIHNVTYEDCPVGDTATWFIDPPYQQRGDHYRFGSRQIDYDRLGEWCKERPGQAIVCENLGANWLPFHPVRDVKTTRGDRLSSEVRWLGSRTRSNCAGATTGVVRRQEIEWASQ